MRTFFRSLMLSFLITAAFPVLDGTAASTGDAARSGVLAAPDCPTGTNWDAVLKRCR
jgi:hypothetical protein